MSGPDGGRDEERRRKLLQAASAAVFLGIVIVAVLIVIASSGSDGGDADDLQGAAEINRELAGIPQSGMTLGDPAARVGRGRVRRPQVPGLQIICRRNHSRGRSSRR